jgi:ribosomal-protein-alanine N-acetyltransferase
MLQLDFSGVPHLTTDRLLMRSISVQDLEALHQLRLNEEVNVMVGRVTPTDLSQTLQYIDKIEDLVEKKECLYWVLTLKEQNELIGIVCCWNFDVQNEIVEIGYEMLTEFQGRGLMKEALKRIINYSFSDLKARLITAFPSIVNVSSVALLTALNFQLADKPHSNIHTNVAGMVTYVLKK